MRIALLCATARGVRFLERLAELAPDAQLLVATFREEAFEPPFFERIADRAGRVGAAFVAFDPRGGGLGEIESQPLDLMLAVNWRFMLPRSVWERPARGTFVFHDSLLPAYRGFSPTVWAMINGEDHTGVTLFEISDDLDAGDIVDQVRVPIGEEDVIATVTERVTEGYLELLSRRLPSLLDGTAPRRRQDQSRATYTCRRLPDDNRIDWTRPSAEVHNLIRAVSAPYPGAFTELDGKPLRVWAARRMPSRRAYVGRVPGRVLERGPEGVLVATGDGAILITEVELERAGRQPAVEVLRSLRQTLGR